MKQDGTRVDYIAAATLLLQLFMSVVDGTIVNIALPVLTREFAVSSSGVIWVVTIYQLAITMLLLSLASLGEKTSYRRLFITGVVIFTLSSAFCGAASSLEMLVAGRAIQGLGSACIMAVNPALIRLVYPLPLLGRGMAFNAMTVATATAIGPTLAGAILTIASWHWLFLINVPLGVISICMAMKSLPPNPPGPDKGKFDKLGAVLNAIVFGLIFYAAGSFSNQDNLELNLALLVLGAIVAVFYIRREMSRPTPIFPLDLFRNVKFTLSIITSICSFTAQSIIMVALPFLFFNALGFSELMLGFLMTPFPIATIIAAPVAAKFVEKRNPAIMAASGMAVYCLGLVLLLGLAPGDKSVADICWRMAICGIGFGMFQTPNNLVMLTSTPLSRSGGAGGMQATARLTGQTLGAVVVGLIFSLVASSFSATRVCFFLALAFAACAGIFSFGNSRKKGLPSNKTGGNQKGLAAPSLKSCRD